MQDIQSKIIFFLLAPITNKEISKIITSFMALDSYLYNSLSADSYNI